MLANLLSRKSFFVEIILGIIFFCLVFFQSFYNQPVGFNWVGQLSFVVFVVSGYLFLKSSVLIKNSAFALFYYLIWVSIFSNINLETQVCVSFLFCTIMFWRMLYVEDHSKSKKYSFSVGFCLGVSVFAYPPSFYLIGLVLLNYFYLQTLNLRVVVLFFLGLILSLILGIQILYLTDYMYLIADFQKYLYRDIWSSSSIVVLLPILVMIIIAWLDHLSSASTQNIYKRHLYFLYFLYFVNWLVIIFFFAGENVNFLAVLGLPISVFLGRYTQFRVSALWKEFLLWTYAIVLLGFSFRGEIIEIYQDLLGNVRF